MPLCNEHETVMQPYHMPQLLWHMHILVIEMGTTSVTPLASDMPASLKFANWNIQSL